MEENKDIGFVISKTCNFFLKKLKDIKECHDQEFRANQKFFINNLIVKFKQLQQIIDFKLNKENQSDRIQKFTKKIDKYIYEYLVQQVDAFDIFVEKEIYQLVIANLISVTTAHLILNKKTYPLFPGIFNDFVYIDQNYVPSEAKQQEISQHIHFQIKKKLLTTLPPPHLQQKRVKDSLLFLDTKAYKIEYRLYMAQNEKYYWQINKLTLNQKIQIQDLLPYLQNLLFQLNYQFEIEQEALQEKFFFLYVDHCIKASISWNILQIIVNQLASNRTTVIGNFNFRYTFNPNTPILVINLRPLIGNYIVSEMLKIASKSEYVIEITYQQFTSNYLDFCNNIQNLNDLNSISGSDLLQINSISYELICHQSQNLYKESIVIPDSQFLENQKNYFSQLNLNLNYKKLKKVKSLSYNLEIHEIDMMNIINYFENMLIQEYFLRIILSGEKEEQMNKNFEELQDFSNINLSEFELEPKPEQQMQIFIRQNFNQQIQQNNLENYLFLQRINLTEHQLKKKINLIIVHSFAQQFTLLIPVESKESKQSGIELMIFSTLMDKFIYILPSEQEQLKHYIENFSNFTTQIAKLLELNTIRSLIKFILLDCQLLLAEEKEDLLKMTAHLNKAETYDFIINLEISFRMPSHNIMAYNDIDLIISSQSNLQPITRTLASNLHDILIQNNEHSQTWNFNQINSSLTKWVYSQRESLKLLNGKSRNDCMQYLDRQGFHQIRDLMNNKYS